MLQSRYFSFRAQRMKGGSMDTNKLTEVIGKYCKNESPGYAIMVDGPWGIGKTHFIDHLFDKKDDVRVIRVSLYGVSSTQQIEDSVFAALIGCADVSDNEIKKAGDFIGKMFSAFGDKADGTAVGAFASISGEALKKRALKNLNTNTVLIFDDFERSKLLQSESLSKINEFVEHQKLKVILLCDERAIKDEKYFETKEKVVLFTNALERSPEEIASICLESAGPFEWECENRLQTELTNIVQKFSLNNIRTVKHGLECFRDIAAFILQIDPNLKRSNILFDMLFSSIALSAGYKDYSVPINELKKTVTNYSDMAVAYHMRDRKEPSGEKPKLTNWERFYVDFLGKGENAVGFVSAFELVCRGYLDVSAISDDLEHWQGRDARPDAPITNFRLDQTIDDTEFKSYIDAALNIISKPSYEFYSTAELYSFCKNLYFIYDHKGFNFDGNFDKELQLFAKEAVHNCLNHTEPSAFGCRDESYEVVKRIFSLLNESSKEISENKVIERAREKLLDELEKGGIERIVDSEDNAFSRSIIDSGFISSLMHMFPKLDNTAVRALGIFISRRFNSQLSYESFQNEIGPLADFEKYLENYLQESGNSLSTMMAHILRQTVGQVVAKAEDLRKKEFQSD